MSDEHMTKPAPAPEGTDPFADRRAHPRVGIALPAFLQAGKDRHFVHLLDVSAGGAKLKCPVRLASGTSVKLECGTIGRGAVVRWQSEGVMGICFERELDSRDVSALENRSAALAERMNGAA